MNPLPTGRYGRFALFIDGSNFFHTIRDLGLHVDYRRLLEYFRSHGTLVRSLYYTALLENSQSPEWLIRLTDWLAYNNYHVVTKSARTFRRRTQDESGEWYWTSEVKGSVHVDIAVDMMSLAPVLDTALLFSGDGEFQALVAAVQRLGCRVIVVSSEKTAESTVANELRRQADEFLDIATISDDIRMVDR